MGHSPRSSSLPFLPTLRRLGKSPTLRNTFSPLHDLWLEFGWFLRVFQACSHHFQKESGIKRQNIMKYQWLWRLWRLWSYSMLFVQFLTFGCFHFSMPRHSAKISSEVRDAQDWTNLNQSNSPIIQWVRQHSAWSSCLGDTSEEYIGTFMQQYATLAVSKCRGLPI